MIDSLKFNVVEYWKLLKADKSVQERSVTTAITLIALASIALLYANQSDGVLLIMNAVVIGLYTIPELLLNWEPADARKLVSISLMAIGILMVASGTVSTFWYAKHCFLSFVKFNIPRFILSALGTTVNAFCVLPIGFHICQIGKEYFLNEKYLEMIKTFQSKELSIPFSDFWNRVKITFTPERYWKTIDKKSERKIEQSDYEKVIKYIEEDAQKDNPKAKELLEILRCHGIETDLIQVRVWLEEAAKQEVALAKYALGCMFLGGIGVEKDYQQAACWFKSAADQGNPRAQYCLSRLFNNGLGVEKDEQKALLLLQKAYDNGDKLAIEHVGKRICHFLEEISIM